jgi:4-alpha-glucanotransferase
MAIKNKEIIREAFKVLGKKNVAFIAHAPSFPSQENENTGFGNAVSNGAKSLFEFLDGVFNYVQLGPAGKTKGYDASPYTGTVFSKNPLLIDLYQLTTEEYFNLLSKETFNKICQNNPKKDTNRTAYIYIYDRQEKALKEAYNNFKELNNDEFKKGFAAFKSENSFWLDSDSLYEVLSIENGNDYWPLWENDDDKYLLVPKNEEEKERYKKRIEYIKEKYADKIEFYAFKQYLAFLQNEKSKDYALSHGIKLIADRQVSFSDRDFWAYQDLFLDGWCMGCPPDLFSDKGQAWGFPVVDPEKLFNKDGSLGPAGELLKKLYKLMFIENTGGVRIDHFVGLIDPWVYKAGKTPKPEDGAGRLYSSPEHPELKKYAIATLEDLNYDVKSDSEKRVKSLTTEQIKKYGQFVEKIVIAAAQEVGLDKNAIVCENLGTVTYPVVKAFECYGLNGMSLTEIVEPDIPTHPYRCKYIVPNCWAIAGSHDNKPVVLWAKDKINTNYAVLQGKNMAEDLYPDATDIERNKIAYKLSSDAEFMAYNKLIEIFACKAENVQIFFTDFFGIRETYNVPSTFSDDNWSLRIPNDFEKLYDENLKNGLAINFPKLLKDAIIARGKDFYSKHEDLIKRLDAIS